MNRSYSKIRHIQEVNQRLENRLLNEQISKTNTNPSSTLPIKKTTSGCNGNNTISSPISKLWDTNDITKKRFSLQMFFNSTSSIDDDFLKGFTDLKTKIIAANSKLDFEKTEIKISSITSIVGSASNHINNRALQPTTNNNGQPITEPDIKYAKSPGPNNINYEKNLKYASSRWESIKNYLKINGKNLGFSIPNKITVTPLGHITDTGGCIDEKRDVTTYPNPGQYAIIQGDYSLDKKMSNIEITEMRSCINNLKVVIGFFTASVPIDNIDVKINTNQDHQCDFATFWVYCNGQLLATVNLNNGNEFFKENPLAKIGAGLSLPSKNNVCEVEYHSPEKIGDTVYSVLTLTKDGVESLINNSPDGKLIFEMVGVPSALTRDKSKSNFTNGGNVHGDAPMVLVYNLSGKKPRVIFHQEPFKGKGGDVAAGKSINIGTFSACNTAT